MWIVGFANAEKRPAQPGLPCGRCATGVQIPSPWRPRGSLMQSFDSRSASKPGPRMACVAWYYTPTGRFPFFSTSRRSFHCSYYPDAPFSSRCRAVMGAVEMFSPYDLRPTILTTEFTLATLSTVVIATRSVSFTPHFAC
jgi:hypothetical protein